MIITSKFPGVCKTCRKAVQVGDRVSWVRGAQGVSHATCSAEGQVLAVQVEASRATDTDRDIPCPESLAYLGYQRAGIAYCLDHSSALIADEMGLGKTIQAIGVLNASPEITRVLIVCPASLKRNWQIECKRWLTRSLSVSIFPTISDITIINYDIVSKLDGQSRWDMLILDEAQYAKNPKAKRTKLVQSLARRCAHVLALTGTPILNKPIELWPILQMVAPKVWDPQGMIKGVPVSDGCGAGFFRFAKRYCNAHQEQVSRSKTVWVFDGHSNLDELQEKLRSTCMVRRLKSDVLAELPPKRRQIITVGNGCSDEDTWGDIGDDYETAHKRVKSIPFEDISRVRHEQALTKVEAASSHIRDAVESSNKVVVFAHHKDVIAALTTELSDLGVVTLTGDTSESDRQSAVERFQTDHSVHVFIGSLKAAGVGLTLTASAHVIFVELDWVPATMTQAEDRCHRIGQTESVLVQHLVLDGSIDAKMTKFITEKQEIADMALDRVTMSDINGHPTIQEALPCTLSSAEISEVLAQIRWLATRCDGAQTQDDAGFNKLDTNFGRTLATLDSLTTRQALVARRMLVKYKKQLSHMRDAYGTPTATLREECDLQD